MNIRRLCLNSQHWLICSLLFLCFANTQAVCEEVTFEARGTLTFVDDPTGSFSIGDPFVTRFTYDTNTPDASADPSEGLFTFSPIAGLADVSIEIAGITFEEDPVGAMTVEVDTSNATLGFRDTWIIAADGLEPAGLTLPPNDRLKLSPIILQSFNELLPNDGLPINTDFFGSDVTVWNFQRESIVTGAVSGGFPSFQVKGRIESLRLVPEPGALLLATFGMAALGWRRRRRT